MKLYSLIYIFIQKLLQKRNPDSQFAAASFVTLIQLVHFLFAFVILRIFIPDISLPVFSGTYMLNKLAMMPFLLVWLIVVHIYFKKRFDRIEEKYSKKKISTFKNGVIVFTSLVVPLIICIILSLNP